MNHYTAQGALDNSTASFGLLEYAIHTVIILFVQMLDMNRYNIIRPPRPIDHVRSDSCWSNLVNCRVPWRYSVYIQTYKIVIEMKTCNRIINNCASLSLSILLIPDILTRDYFIDLQCQMLTMPSYIHVDEHTWKILYYFYTGYYFFNVFSW